MLRLSDVSQAFVRANPHWTSHTKARVESHLAVIVELLGDRDIRSYTKQDIRILRDKLPYVPSNARKRGEPLVGGNPPYLSVKSLNDLLTWVRSMWRYAELSYDEVVSNPTVALLSFKGATVVRDAIPDEALGEWLCVTKYPTLVRTLSLSGARLGELAMATPRDIDNATRSLTIRPTTLRRLKNTNSQRTVPLHSSIDPDEVRAGLPFARTQRGLTLLSKRLNYELDKVIDDDKVCVHSLRHWFATKLKETGCEDSLVADLMGHKLGTMTSRYAKSASLERMRIAIEQLSLPASVTAGLDRLTLPPHRAEDRATG